MSSRLMWMAMVVSVIGGSMWAYGAMTRSAKSSGNSSSPGMALVQSDGGEGAHAAAEPGLTEKAGRWLIKLGPSFIAGFLIGWGIRRFLKWTLLLVAIAGVGLYLLKHFGVFDVNYDDVKESVDQGVEWAKEHVTEAKDWALRYVPSGTTAVVGMFFGARR
jgi:uncharacterized membrane protein (Fun14 family)